MKEEIETERGAILYPVQDVFRRNNSKSPSKINCGHESIWSVNIRFPDVTVLIAENREDLQQMVDRVVEVTEKNGLSHNIKKTWG